MPAGQMAFHTVHGVTCFAPICQLFTRRPDAALPVCNGGKMEKVAACFVAAIFLLGLAVVVYSYDEETKCSAKGGVYIRAVCFDPNAILK